MKDPRTLPIYGIEAELRAAVAANPVVVVESPTGSGKTTQIPQILYRAGLSDYGVIGVTQPRRIAAVSVSARIAAEMGVRLGTTVGYKMRFVDETGPDTRIKIMTDGILLQELRADPLLRQYAMMMVDEAHERSLNIDFILGLLKEILRHRRDLRVLVSSATLNARLFCEYFGGAPLLQLDVKPWPIEVHHVRRPLPAGETALVDATVERVAAAVRAGAEGDVLIFLPGEAPILDCVERLRSLPEGSSLAVLPLFGRLTKEEQDRVFDEVPGKRKVVVATNIAETSITIDGVRIVVDSGVAKVKSFNHETGIGALQEEPVSRASADQRRGRAGRTAPGTCYRLYTRHAYEERPLFSAEEIRRTDLSEVVLRMLSLGVRDVDRFDFITPPAPGAIHGALEILQRLRAVTPDRRLTEVGERMIDLPLEPRIGRMVVEATMRAPDVLDEVVTIAAFLSARSPFALVEGREEEAREQHRRFEDSRGDFHAFLKVFRAYHAADDKALFCGEAFLDLRALAEIANVREQLLQLLAERGHHPGHGGKAADVVRTVATGLVQLICRRDARGGGYRSLTTRGIHVHPGSSLFHHPPECFVAGEIVRTRRTFARSAARMEPEWVAEVAPETFEVLFGHGRRPRAAHTEPPPPPPSEIRIGDRAFPVEATRNQLLVTLTWEALSTLPRGARVHADGIPGRDLKGQILVGDGYLLRGARVPAILRAAPFLRVAEGLLERWPADEFFTLPGRARGMTKRFGDILRLVRPGAKEGGGRRRAYAFLSFCANGNGGYWFDVSYDLADAVAASLAALEFVVDDLRAQGLEEEAAWAEARHEQLTTIEAALESDAPVASPAPEE